MPPRKVEEVIAVRSLGEWVTCALRQLDRAHQAAIDDLSIRLTGTYDPRVQIIHEEIYFLLLATHHALVSWPSKVREIQATLGPDENPLVVLPKPTTVFEVEKLRDVYEHENQPKRLGDAGAWATTSSGKALAEQRPEAMPWGVHYGDDGLGVIADVLRADLLRGDLEAMWAAVEPHCPSAGKSSW